MTSTLIKNGPHRLMALANLLSDGSVLVQDGKIAAVGVQRLIPKPRLMPM